MSVIQFQERIEFQGDLVKLFELIVKDYSLGLFKEFKVVELGYEDFNVILETSLGKYFVKFFAKFRTPEDIERYVNIMLEVIKSGVNHPKLYKSAQGYLSSYEIEGSNIKLCLLEYVDSGNLYQTNEEITNKDLLSIINQVASIQNIQITPPPIYDSWSIINFKNEFELHRSALTDLDLKLIEPIYEKFKELDLKNLPHTFVHGDIIKTNVIKSQDKIYILDFSVANTYPRIQELAVLLCNIFFYEDSKEQTLEVYQKVVQEYSKRVNLTKEELQILSLYVKAAHAMHIIGPSKLIFAGEDSVENQYWLNLGRKGLQMNYL